MILHLDSSHLTSFLRELPCSMKPRIPPLRFACLLLLSAPTLSAQAFPPFSGTIFIDPNIITAADPTTFTSLSDAGQGNRWMFDRRSGWVFLNAFLFNATYSNGQVIEVQVNPEFATVDAARVEAQKYAPVIGQLPRRQLRDVQTVWIHRGIRPFGGGNNNLLIHTGQAELYEADGILEEVLVHEAAHTSLDADFASSPGWLAARAADGRFISIYAWQYPLQEDIAESFLPWLALRYRRDRIPDSLANTIQQTIPNRIAFFDAQRFDMYPFVGQPHYSDWFAGHPTIASSRPNSDPDGDGISNLLEFVLGGNPTVPDRAILGSLASWSPTTAESTDGQFSFTFSRRAVSIPQVELIFQHSSDLITWSDIAIDPPGSAAPGLVTLGPIVGGMQPVTITLPASSAPGLFVRLKASASLPSGNLLVNGSGESPPDVGWTILANGGNGWSRIASGGFDGIPGYFVTSFGWGRRFQLVDLLAAGFTPAELDEAPRIRVGEAISSYFNNQPDSFYIRVELRGQDQNVIASWNAGTFAAPLQATTNWVMHQHDFTGYGPGVRYVYFEDGGIDRGFWAGHFGTYHDAASVEVLPGN
ncbi:MAG: hypothetical protein EA425_10085 [Puniceicoccaceae bacterium]|nr:MAG: hypothetical protein EA425_10085 [Puniceicoccaceae bacterium]